MPLGEWRLVGRKAKPAAARGASVATLRLGTAGGRRKEDEG